ncbi:MAG: TlpA disulfide reductase family protein [Candidatus Kapabacteria bacterium]|nr:TlpA disulfide reductase family protein [Candidatus Kapabacteria bacterium]
MNKIYISILFFVVFAITAGSVEINSTAPDFKAVDINGKEISLKDFKGKVIILDFWASWCGPCVKELPFLSELYNKYKDQGLEVVAVNIDKRSKNAKKFLKRIKFDPNFSIILDNEQKIPPKFNFETMPTTFIIDKTGLIRFIHEGFTEDIKSKFEKELKELL